MLINKAATPKAAGTQATNLPRSPPCSEAPPDASPPLPAPDQGCPAVPIRPSASCYSPVLAPTASGGSPADLFPNVLARIKWPPFSTRSQPLCGPHVHYSRHGSADQRAGQTRLSDDVETGGRTHAGGYQGGYPFHRHS